jgi:Na+-driven multidrug efflux pump
MTYEGLKTVAVIVTVVFLLYSVLKAVMSDSREPAWTRVVLFATGLFGAFGFVIVSVINNDGFWTGPVICMVIGALATMWRWTIDPDDRGRTEADDTKPGTRH